MRRLFLIAIASLFIIKQSTAQGSSLNPGDIAIIAFQSDNNDQFAFISLVDLAPSTQIQFSEKGWNASLPTPAFVSTTEGVHTWTAPVDGLSKGNIVLISFNSLGTGPIANFGTVQSTAAAKLSTSGDELIAFQGNSNNPHFIYAFGSRPWLTTGTPSSNQSWLPAPLVNGISARDFVTENDDQYFKLTDYAASKDSLLAAIGNIKNWTRSNTRFSSLPNWQLQILTHYYLKASANPTQLENWGVDLDGMGQHPTSFIAKGNVFHLANTSGIVRLTSNWTIDQLFIHSNTQLSLEGFELSVSNFIDSSQGTIIGSDSSSLIISGKSGALKFEPANAMLNKLTLLKNASTSLSNSLKINSQLQIGVLSLGDSSQFNSNGYLVLSATEKGASTLSFGKNAKLMGPVEVQKYIPAGKRNYRFLGHPFANSIALSQLTSDIDITGKEGATNGFTTTNTNNPSAFWYNPLLGDSLQSDLGWTAFTHTNGMGSNAWLPKQGIRINIRGSKNQGLNGLPYSPASVTLHLKDSLNSCSQTAILTKNSKNAGYNLIGNPFAATIDMSQLKIGEKIVPNYYVWDPWLGNKGGYSCYPFTSNIQLPSFAAFFAQTIDSSNGNTIYFPEECIASNYNSIKILGNTEKPNNQLELIVEADSSVWDRAVILFKNNASDSLDFFDAKKWLNPDFSLFSWSADHIKLCIDNRSNTRATTIPLGVVSNISKTFQLKVARCPELPGYNLYLLDKKTKSRILLEEQKEYSFQETDTLVQKDTARFEIQMIGKNTAINLLEVPNLSCQVFPNPAGNRLTVQIQSQKRLPIFIAIKNLAGQTLLQKELEPALQLQYTVMMDQWAAGIYVITVSNKEESIAKKFIKN